MHDVAEAQKSVFPLLKNPKHYAIKKGCRWLHLKCSQSPYPNEKGVYKLIQLMKNATREIIAYLHHLRPQSFEDR